jgi:branched-chain amino acid transport system ATP-binding protein
MEILKVEGVSMRFGGLAALSNVSFGVEQGSIFGLMGANGAGKTTLFAVIGGQLRPTEGRVLFKNQVLNGKRPDQICRLGVSRTFQVVKPFYGISVLDNVTVSALYGMSERRSVSKARQVGLVSLEAVGLADSADALAGSLTLSGQKRLEIARALATGAELLLLDEVMAGLTPPEIEQMIETLAGLRKARDLTFVIVEHVMGALMKLSDRILALDHGVQIAMGPPKEVASDENVLRVYFGCE